MDCLGSHTHTIWITVQTKDSQNFAKHKYIRPNYTFGAKSLVLDPKKCS